MDGDFDDWPGVVQSDTCPPAPDSNQRYQVWQCVKVIPEEIEKWLWMIRQDARAGGAIEEIDELSTMVYKTGTYSDELNINLKTGRSIGLGTFGLTQELSRIPPNIYKQATHRLGFYIDRAARYDHQIWQALLKSKVDDPPDEWGLYYQAEKGRGEPRYYKTIQEFLGVR